MKQHRDEPAKLREALRKAVRELAGCQSQAFIDDDAETDRDELRSRLRIIYTKAARAQMDAKEVLGDVL